MAELINFIGTFFYIAIFARIVISWFPGSGKNPIVILIYTVTEPILAPIRRHLPRFGMFDFTPMVALLLILFVQNLLIRFLG